MLINWWPMLLPVAMLSGFFAGKKEAKKKEPAAHPVTEKYVRGLNFLLNDKPDKAIDVFIELLEVDSDTVETHLALGSLFRNRGEVDRAIRIHQNLIARPALDNKQRVDALMALGQDYMRAGVLDRAERIFKEVAKLAQKNDVSHLRCLLDIYQQQRAWEQALEVLSAIQSKSGQSCQKDMSHCYAELAQLDLDAENLPGAEMQVKKAFQCDRASVRASLILGEIESRKGQYARAIKAYKRVPGQDEAFISEIVEPIYNAYMKLNQEVACLKYFEWLLERSPRSTIIFKIASHIKIQQGMEEALDYASEQLNAHPSVRGLNQLIVWYLGVTYGKVHQKLKMLYNITHQLVESEPLYRCTSCGFSGKHLHWLCPSCRKWNTVKPIHGIKGD